LKSHDKVEFYILRMRGHYHNGHLELALYLLIPRLLRFPRFIEGFNTNTSLVQIQNLIYDIFWNQCTSIRDEYVEIDETKPEFVYIIS